MDILKYKSLSWRNNMYYRDYQIRYSECGASQRIKIVNIFHYLQDAADEHALSLGISAGQLQSHGYAWILYKSGLKINRYPLQGETISIRTWPWMQRNLYELRMLEVRDEEGQMLFEANTCWLMVDLAKGNPVRLNRTPFIEILRGENEIRDDFRNIPSLTESESEITFKVRLHDLDANRHVNNAIYPEWAIETIPQWGKNMDMMEKYQYYRPYRIEINYQNPALYGDRVLCQTAMTESVPDPVFLHRISRESDKKELARLRTTWKNFG